MVLSTNYVADSEGNYNFSGPASPQQILDLASDIVEQRMCRDGEIISPSDSILLITRKLAHREQEVFCGLFLDNRHRVISFEEMFFGTVNGSSVHPREVVKTGLFLNAAAVVVAHNHPSGLPEPSAADRALTRRLTEALALVDIRLIDHIVVGGNDTVSFAERGML